MNTTLLQQQFERLGRNPGDSRLLKQLAVALGAALIRSRPEAIRAYRVAAASALRACEEAKAETTSAALAALFDTAASAEEALTAEREREDVRAVASRPLHRAVLRELSGVALTGTALGTRLDRYKSQMHTTLRELEAAGLICAVEGLGGDQRGKPYRLTLTGATLLDDLPADEPAAVACDPKDEEPAYAFEMRPTTPVTVPKPRSDRNQSPIRRHSTRFTSENEYRPSFGFNAPANAAHAGATGLAVQNR